MSVLLFLVVGEFTPDPVVSVLSTETGDVEIKPLVVIFEGDFVFLAFVVGRFVGFALVEGFVGLTLLVGLVGFALEVTFVGFVLVVDFIVVDVLVFEGVTG